MRYLAALVLATAVLASSCGGDDDETTGAPEGAGAPMTATSETTVEPEPVEVDGTVGGARVACPAAKTFIVEYSPGSGANFQAEGAELTRSLRLRTGPSIYEYAAAGCIPAGSEGGTLIEPYEVATDAITLECRASKNVELSGRADLFDGQPGYEISAALAGTPDFFLKTHWEPRAKSGYVAYSPKYCTQR